MEQGVTFYSDGCKIHGDLCVPDDLKPGEKRSGIVLIHGFATAATPSMYAMAKEMCRWGYIALNFHFRGFGRSEGSHWRMLALEQVEDTRNAISFLQQHASVQADHIGLYGASFGGGIAIYTTGLDSRVRCIATVATVGNGLAWMRSLRRAWEWNEFSKVLKEDQIQRAVTGKSKVVPRGEILKYEPTASERPKELKNVVSEAASELSLLTAQAIVDFAPDLMARRIVAQPALFIVAENDTRAPPEVAWEVFKNISGPKRWVVIPGIGHDGVYVSPGWERHVDEVRKWMFQHLPVHGEF